VVVASGKLPAVGVGVGLGVGVGVAVGDAETVGEGDGEGGGGVAVGVPDGVGVARAAFNAACANVTQVFAQVFCADVVATARMA
jgi:hypothetical protein